MIDVCSTVVKTAIIYQFATPSRVIDVRLLTGNGNWIAYHPSEKPQHPKRPSRFSYEIIFTASLKKRILFFLGFNYHIIDNVKSHSNKLLDKTACF